MWQRLDPRELSNVGGNNHLVQYVYGWNGGKWPRLTLSIFADAINGNAETAVTVSCDEKQGKEDWWAKRGVPRELIGDLKELLDEAMRTPYEPER